jgi:hypothetical protein
MPAALQLSLNVEPLSCAIIIVMRMWNVDRGWGPPSIIMVMRVPFFFCWMMKWFHSLLRMWRLMILDEDMYQCLMIGGNVIKVCFTSTNHSEVWL